ncbi:beta-lactamase/transpeptidase-like protein [Clathrospora elynae]|uniref:Beta-lactamase/transpeptidase-like protein n=1 Tax=Clathrospora elynae TaxID=706981 RepID=A0A6A5SSQ0_9PLEO|nr:beta-lactamase/transpeptidase-like protein [Clathrospora elynae]
MAPSLTPQSTQALKVYIDNATNPSTASPVLPAALLHIVDAQNNVLFTHGSGPEATPTLESIGHIQSLSKLVGAIAYMQLVERGLATLDDPSIITTHLPELAAKQVLTGYTVDADTGKKIWTFEARKGDIIPRMLLNHTYGGGNTHFNTMLLEYLKDKGEDFLPKINESADPYGTLLISPLLWQPGTKTNYAQGLDWIAMLIERITNQSLNSYLEENIFAPLGLLQTGLQPLLGGGVLDREGNKGKFWPRKMRMRTETTVGDFVTIDPPDLVQVKRADAWPAGTHHTLCLSAGLISSARDYAHILTTLFPHNCGRDPVSGHRLLSPVSVAEITSPQLPPHLRNNSRKVPTSGDPPGGLSIMLPTNLEAPERDPEGSYGLACAVQGADRVLKEGGKGRSKGSVYWYGAANTEYWVDGVKGIAVFVNGNYHPWNDQAWTEFVTGVEGLVYAGLEG